MFNIINLRGLSVNFAAPEAFNAFRDKIYTGVDFKKYDMYSFACVTYEVLVKNIKVIILCLCAAISVTSADNEFKKYLSAKKSSFDYLPGSLVGMYKNWHISYVDSDIHFIDVDTGALVKTITGF
ncbi:hypothetical protein MP638_004115, partial [Amoeboaphelidium occidentale]